MLCVHSVLALAVHRVTRELDPLLLQRRSGGDAGSSRALPGVTPKGAAKPKADSEEYSYTYETETEAQAGG